jgi:phosphate transport system permease protein
MTTVEIAGIKSRKVKDRMFRSMVFVFSFCCVAMVLLILVYIFKKGVTCVDWNLFTQMPKPPMEKGGGVLNAIVGSLMVITVASIIAIPLGIAVGIFLAENKGKFKADRVGIAVDVLQGVPSIVVGMVVYVWIVVPMHTFSAIAGCVALAIMMLPPVIKSTEETLLLIPNTLREASLALGASDLRTTMKVLLPTGIGGIFAGATLGIARIAGEVAPLLFTALGSKFLSFDFKQPIGALPLMIYNYGTSPYDEWQRIAWGASVLLVGFILILNFIVKFFENRWKVQF